MKIDKHKRPISRREFFSFLVPLLSVPAIFWWVLTGSREKSYGHAKKILEVSSDIPAGISFQKDVIFIKEEGALKAFEAKCTHLGCRINKAEGNELICGCHGSRFDALGNAIRGPAINPLTELEIRQDTVSGNLIIQKR